MDPAVQPIKPPGMMSAVVVCILAGLFGLFFGELAIVPYQLDLMGVYYRPPTTQTASERAAEETRHERRMAIQRRFSIITCTWSPATGILVGIAWHLSMRRRWLRDPSRSLTWAGTKAGALAGVISTLLVHAALMWAAGTNELSALGIGLLVGLPAGAILGVFCGSAYERARRRLVAGPASASPGGEPWA